MNRAIVRRAVRDLRWQVAWYGLGLALYAGLMVVLFPTFQDFLGDAQYPEEFLEFFGGSGVDFASPEGFITTEYFSIAPVIYLVFAVVAGTGMLAGDEGRGTLENLLAQPVSRTTLFISRAAGLLAAAVLICLVNSLGWVVTFPFVDLEGVSLLELLLATLGVLPVLALFAALAMLLGAVAPSRGLAAGALSALVIVTYLLDSFSQTIEALEWTQHVNPYWYSDASRVLTQGVVWWHQLLLVGVAAMCFALAAVAFAGREIAAGVWQPAAVVRGWRILGASE